VEDRASGEMPPVDGANGRAPDDAAVAAAARHDRQAFAPLYHRYADRIYRYCFRRLGSREAAEDATAVVFTKALAGIDGFRGGFFAAWLFAIAHNVCASASRRRVDLTLDAADDLPSESGESSPEAAAFAADDRRTLERLLAVLPGDQRRVVELRLAGLTGAEIAETMGRSLAAVKMLQVRAFARMRAAHAAGVSDEEHRGPI